MVEIWKDVKGYEGIYQISNYGKVKSVRNNVIRKTTYGGKGYERINLTVNGKTKYYYIHRLVAEAFIPNNEKKQCVNHKDNNILNNNVNNLEWCTHKENNNYKDHNLRNHISSCIYFMKKNHPEEINLINDLKLIKEKIYLL